ncbi:hypothetical protein GCM10009789_27660 [Kribbella sancticallisti]|uniref:Beta-lactamase-related domain-containing protein n=1 Tax=Kribbella sancticallisti TaxID=460087 RepID=A0ABP4P2L7_9ACTN
MAFLTDQGRAQEKVCLGVSSGSTSVSEATTFDAASLTKPFFARYVLELAAAGDLELEEPLAAQVDFAEFGAAPDPRLRLLTPAMVLSHHTGFPNWRPDGSLLRLDATPGETFGYSGEGFQLLLKALQNRRGAPQVLAELEGLLRRLGMTRSSFVDHPDPDRAVAHDPAGNPLPAVPRVKLGAYGNLDTCLDDYVRFVTSTFWGDAAAAVRESMTRPYSEGREGGRTLGWGWWSRSDGQQVLWQNGDNPGFKHLVLVTPSAGEALVVFTNGDAGLAITDAASAWFRAAGVR